MVVSVCYLYKPTHTFIIITSVESFVIAQMAII